MFPYVVIGTESNKVGLDGFIKFTISNFPAILFAINKRWVTGSWATISAEFDPLTVFEKLDNRFNDRVFDAWGITLSLSEI